MTITPMAPPLLALAAEASGTASRGDGAGTFGTLIAVQLQLLEEPVPEQPAGAAITEDTAVDAESEAGGDDADATASAVAPAMELGSPTLATAAVAAGPVPAPVPSPPVAAVPDPETESDGAPVPESSNRESRGRSAQLPGHTVVPLVQVGEAPRAHARSGDPQDAPAARQDAPVTTPNAPATPQDAPVTPQDDAAAAVAGPLAEVGAESPNTLSVAVRTESAPGASPTPVSLVSPAAASAPAPAAIPVEVAPATRPSAPANAVLDQVASVFTRLVSGPEGQHRMTLRLHPADLGEVHLTVTVKGDTVQITVSARPEAREMLADGSSQLRSLLDSVGRTAERIVFRDLPGTGTTVQVVTTSGDTSSQPGPSYADSGRAGNGSQRGQEGQGRSHGPEQPETDRSAAHHRTTTTQTTNTQTSTAAGFLRGGLDVRM